MGRIKISVMHAWKKEGLLVWAIWSGDWGGIDGWRKLKASEMEPALRFESTVASLYAINALFDR